MTVAMKSGAQCWRESFEFENKDTSLGLAAVRIIEQTVHLTRSQDAQEAQIMWEMKPFCCDAGRDDYADAP